MTDVSVTGSAPGVIDVSGLAGAVAAGAATTGGAPGEIDLSGLAGSVIHECGLRIGPVVAYQGSGMLLAGGRTDSRLYVGRVGRAPVFGARRAPAFRKDKTT